MGVKELWSTLVDTQQQVGIEHLQGKTLAVDFSGWLYQGERSGGLQGKQGIKPHLRNLFWRVSLLQRYHVKLVFVFDGPAPSLKRETLAKRAEQTKQFYSQVSPKRARVSDSQSSKKTDNSESDVEAGGSQTGASQKIQECCSLLDALGVPYLTAPSEAEALCAALNNMGVVDGCITDDSDAFLFGAKCIYKNFGTKSAEDKTIEYYEMDAITSQLGLNREKLVAMALLTGGDYDGKGVRGMGKEHTLRLLKELPTDGALQRLRELSASNCDLDDISSPSKKKPSHCSKCDHTGTVTLHKSSSCDTCGLSSDCTDTATEGHVPCSCTWHNETRLYGQNSLQIKVRQKARETPGFPSEEIINMYMSDHKPSTEQKESVKKWNRPNFETLRNILKSSMHWEDEKIVSRLLPLVTAWDMMASAKNLSPVEDKTECNSMPERILSSRTSKKQRIFDVQWKHVEGVPDELLSLSKPAMPAVAVSYSGGVTEELQSHMEDAFPWIVRFFHNERAPAKGKRKLSVRDQVTTKQRKIDKMFTVRKKLNFAGGKDGTDGEPSQGAVGGSDT